MIDLPLLIQQCVPAIVQKSMLAIVQVESKNNPLSLNINKGFKLQFQPHSVEQAHKWVEYLESNHYNFDIGLAQVNISNVHKYGYKAIELLDPCTNLKLGSAILMKNYTSALPSSKSATEALQKAISAYNTGNFYTGFSNGYVSKVNTTTNKTILALNSNSDIPPIIGPIIGPKNGSIIDSKSKPADLHTKHSTIALDSAKTTSNPYSSRSVLYIQQRKLTPDQLSSTEGI